MSEWFMVEVAMFAPLGWRRVWRRSLDVWELTYVSFVLVDELTHGDGRVFDVPVQED